jgi:ATP-dependent RNA helicase SUPV3L1/SUV3
MCVLPARRPVPAGQSLGNGPRLTMTVENQSFQPLVLSGRDVTAVLGPTNTGKTHLAIERMVAHESGVIGLPLRLLAREVYGRVCEKVGAKNVALVTGEEKITPANARYSVCTVEAMPRQTDAAFVAIDEVQLANDLERGHIFTDRILHLRGRQETLLLGAATMRGILEKLLKGISVVTRPRLSHLAYAGSKKITRLPRRSAVVAFSADEVYAIGELIRRQRGGVAVVLGALSPRTRNAQVEIYQSGDVDYLVATDAIGMGLNLDVDHVAFAQNRKFDGYQFRDLSPAEIGQIAGRAGRHLRDGTFGVTGRVDPLADDLVAKVEGHDFEPVKVLQWRNNRCDFSSIDALKRSIETPAPVEGLTRALPAVDAQALETLSRDGDVRALATRPERVRLLWEACALPDYRRIAPAQHAELVASIFFDLARRGAVDESYMAAQVERADSPEGDIDTLSHRIAQIRTWTFVANQANWLADPAHWREKTRAIEDRLSDALHERLTKRFVDRRTSVLQRRLRENTMLEAEISPSGTVTVEGHHVGELQGFRFTADASAGGEEAKAVRGAAQKALATEFETRAGRFATAPNGDIALASDGTLRWLGAPIGALTASEDALKPRVVLFADEQLTGAPRDAVQARAERFVQFQIESLLKPLLDLRAAEALAGLARGIAFRLIENFGVVFRRDIADDMKALDSEGRAALRRLGVRFGAYHVFVPALVKPAPAGLITLLWALKNDGKDLAGFGDVVHALASGRTSVVADPAFDRRFFGLAGYRVLGRRAVRVDILERLADLIRPALSWKPGTPGKRPDGAYDGNAFLVTGPMMSILGAGSGDMEEVLKALGYRSEAKPAAQVKERLDALDQAARDAEAERQRAAAQAAALASEPAQGATGDAAVEVASGAMDAGGPLGPVAGEDVPAVADGAAGDGVDAAPAIEAAGPGAALPDGGALAETAETASMVAPEAVESAAASAAEPAQPTPEAAEGSAVAPEAVADAVSQPVAAPAEEPKPVLLWRPGRPEHRGAPRGRDNRFRGEQGAEGRRDGGRRFERSERGPRPDGQQQPAAAAGAGEGQPRREQRFEGAKRPWERRDGERRDGEGRNFRKGGANAASPGGRDGQRGGKERGENEPRRERPNFAAKPREERPVRIDPDSPFAKLAALRDQLRK